MGKVKLVGIRIDIETRSRLMIATSGVYPYAEDPDFAVLTISYAKIGEHPGGARAMGPMTTLDMDDPDEVALFTRRLHAADFEKHAYNAAFERVCLSKWLGFPNGIYLDPVNWHCSAIRANVNGVFGTLDEVARALRSPIRKDAEGKRLINLFSKPDKKTGEFHDPCIQSLVCWCGAVHTEDFTAFQSYCDQDVKTEAAVAALTPDIPDSVQREYEMDQRINDRGVRHFKTLSARAVEAVATEKDRIMGELKVLTGLDNPNSNQQMNRWLADQDFAMVSLDKAHREEALADPMIPDDVAEVLRMKGAASLSSVTKHKAALNTRCADGRIRGSLQFYGAHTGREAGRGIQPQNLPRYQASLPDIKRLLAGTAGADAPQIAKGSVRSSLVPRKGSDFVVFDYNAIEARVLGNLTGEKWVEAEFAGAGKIYEATAHTMFGTDKDKMIRALSKQYGCDKCGVCSWCITRAQAKVANLALGYGGGAGALVTMGAADAGIDIGNYAELNAEWKALGMPGEKFHAWEPDRHDYPELLRLRDLYRSSSPMTVRFWKLCARAFDMASSGKGVRFGNHQMLAMVRDGRHNRLVLPSGRSIWYRYGRTHYSTQNPEYVEARTFVGKGKGIGHQITMTHGGKLCENVTQAVARDVLFDLMTRIEAKTAAGWPGKIVLHVHDEVVIEVPKAHTQEVFDDVKAMMDIPPAWAPTLQVRGEGNVMVRYGK